jgi:putative heme-binding domain-containing protein
LTLAAPLWAQRDAPVPNPDPELERKSFQIADGFEVSLWAADPLLAKPIQMSFGPDGRLWVACSEAYPQIKPGQKQNDRILILEDRAGKGQADKVTVFADGLLIPTGLEPGDGGVYVADSTDLVHFSDPDASGKARKRRVLLSGFGTEDTHHLIHTLRWGPDGMLYFNQSVYIHSHVETPYGVRRLGGGGIWKYRPETQQLEVFARGFWNPWGHHFDRWGQSFITDGAGTEGINYGIPGATYTPSAKHVVPGLNPGHPKYCGLEILSGRHLPEDWRGSLITHDFRGHRVCRFTVVPDGAGYAARQQGDLIRTNHPAFRPVDVKLGPDGAIYIADWYNPIIQHGEVDFRDPRRDVTHGRIWRVTAKGRPLVEKPKLVDAKVEDLLTALEAPEDWTRHHARRVLKERGAKEVLPALRAWTGKQEASEVNRLEALWTFQSLDVVEPKLLVSLLHASDARIRAGATRVLSCWHERMSNPLELLAARVADDHPQVRLEAVRALGQIKGARSVELALAALERPMDRFLDYGLWLTLQERQEDWLTALRAGRFNYEGNVRRLLYALQAVGSPDVVAPLVALVRSGKVPAEGEEGVLAVVASLGKPAEVAIVLERALREQAPAKVRVALLQSLEQAARQRGVKPAGDLGAVRPLLHAESELLRAAAARLAGVWGLEAARSDLLALARAKESSDALHQAGIEGLAALGGKESARALADLAAQKDAATGTRRLALVALAGLDLDAAATQAAEVLALAPDGAGCEAVIDAFVQRKQGAETLARKLAGAKLPADVAKVAVRTVRSSGRESPDLVTALSKAGGLSTGPRVLSRTELDTLAADVRKLGDAVRGEALYRRKDQLCMKCHAIGGAGGQVGPDLTSIGASAPVDYLIESLLDPNKAIKEGYHSVIVGTDDGRIITGIKVRSSDKELVLRTAEDREVTVPRSQIERESQGRSLMPDGLTDSLTRGELLDMVRFLSELGKIGPYSVSKARLVRRWQALEPTADAYRVLYRQGYIGAAGDDAALLWSPAYGSVAGELPLDSIPRLKLKKAMSDEVRTIGIVRFQIDVTTAGPVLLKLGSARGLSLWREQSPVDAKAEMVLDLPVGLSTFTVAIDLGERSEPLRLELDDVPGSPARARVIGGK